ncbi:MAG: phenylalanine--tRNA ligase subunit beta [Rhodospirillales bacterium]|nr:phenylalanine--tRNA ligase subunit beta [Rhodospirillales bacterium]
MKFTVGWLKEHLDTTASLDEISVALTALGLEVESITDRAENLSDFTVGEIVTADPHPDADKLQVCTVNTGADDGELVQVVCGAPNARAGLKGVFAGVGVYVPGSDMTLRKVKIRGVESTGMMCSAAELELSDDHDGIIELSDDAVLGAPAAEALGLTDTVIEIAITPNRGDCLGVYGIARDLAAAGLGSLKPMMPATVKGTVKDIIGITIDFPDDASNACPHFVGRVIRGVKNGESPDWLKEKLIAVGLRPISVLVDITNYFTMDRGRPLHVFDQDTIAGNLTVRLSKKGEKLAALDGVTYDVEDGACVIADDDGVLSLGGIMGGISTGCTETTTNVVLEAASFDPIRTAMTGRRLGIESDARYRFERGVDPASTLPGIEAATQLILDLCGGEAGDVVEAGKSADTSSTLVFAASEVHRRGGIELPETRISEILSALGFDAKKATGGLQITIPSWRPDVTCSADLVEEVLRIEGYDTIPAVALPKLGTLSRSLETPTQRRSGFCRRALAARGMNEAVTYSFIAEDHAKLFGGGSAELKLQNPISSELTDMRPSILPALLAAVGRNADRGFGDIGLFEVGPSYANATPEGQALIAGGVRAGQTGPRHWARQPRAVDAFDARADAEAILAECGVNIAALQVVAIAPDWYHPGRSGTLQMGPKNILATFGELHPGVLAAMDIAGPVAGFEVMLNAIPESRSKSGKARGRLDLSSLQAVKRDFAFLTSTDVSAQDVLRAVRSADKALISGARIFDVYTGEGVPEGSQSLAVEVTLQPVKATLTDADIDAVSKKIVAAGAKATGATLRG